MSVQPRDRGPATKSFSNLAVPTSTALCSPLFKEGHGSSGKLSAGSGFLTRSACGRPAGLFEHGSLGRARGAEGVPARFGSFSRSSRTSWLGNSDEQGYTLVGLAWRSLPLMLRPGRGGRAAADGGRHGLALPFALFPSSREAFKSRHIICVSFLLPRGGEGQRSTPHATRPLLFHEFFLTPGPVH